MAKAEFMFIGKRFGNKPQQGTMRAIKLSKKDKAELYPYWDEDRIKSEVVIIPQTDTIIGKDKVFVRGLGTKKMTKTNSVSIPYFSGNVEDWDSYLATYGKHCLFYSLSGYSLFSWDCCAYSEQREFNCILSYSGGIRHYQEFVKKLKKIQEIQTNKIIEMLWYESDYSVKYTIEKTLFQPSYSIMGILPTPPMLNTIEDDEKCEKLYRKIRTHELEMSHPKHERLVHLLRVVNENVEFYNNKWYMASEEAKEIQKEISEYVDNVVTNEITEGCESFPVCMKDRIEILFGRKCSELYKAILDETKI